MGAKRGKIMQSCQSREIMQQTAQARENNATGAKREEITQQAAQARENHATGAKHGKLRNRPVKRGSQTWEDSLPFGFE